MAIIFAKQFRNIVDDFDTATQNAFGVLKKNSGDGDKDPDPDGKKLKEELKELDKKEDDLLAGLDQITVRATKSLDLYDVERRELEAEIKDLAKDKNTTPPDAEDFEHSFEASKKALEKFILRVRADVMGRKDLGDRFPRAAAALFSDLKQLQASLRKDAAKLLNKAEGDGEDDKPLEVEPTTFLIDYKKLVKDIAKDLKEAKGDDAKVKKFKENAEKALENVDDRLKRVDTNHSFDKVESLCDVAVGAIKDVIKALSADREYSSISSSLLKLVREIEAYDKKMFLFSRLKN
jgi:hypothetical protein